MKRMPIPWAVLPLVAACADRDMLTSSDALTSPSAAVVTGTTNNQMNAGAFGDGVFLFVSDRKFDFTHGSLPTKSVNLVIETFSASSFCLDGVPLSSGDFSWSMSHAEVNASTACGQVNVSWSRTGPVTTDNFEGWFSSPTPGIATCSPPPRRDHLPHPDQRGTRRG